MSLLARQLCCRLASQVGQRSLATTPCLKAAKTEKDQMTHTGQQFSESDPRNVRFAVTGLEKQVNNQWAIDLIKEVPPIAVNKRVVGLVLQSSGADHYYLQVSCDGGGGALGHPRVYINLDDGKPVSCIYCGLRYIFDPKA